MNYDLINKLSDIEESPSLAGFLFKENSHYVTFYKIEVSEKRAPEVTECINIDKKFTCKALFQMLSISFTTVVSPRHWLSSNKKKHARELSSIPQNLR